MHKDMEESGTAKGSGGQLRKEKVGKQSGPGLGFWCVVPAACILSPGTVKYHTKTVYPGVKDLVSILGRSLRVCRRYMVG